ncbi:MAG: MATE family efflux transporter, partial [Eubacterium sp.]|nr:MATE family efflux transporter [Eubacterium sp.]
MTSLRNMTSGSPGRLILSFALPLMLGNLFQQFYTIADAAIVGQVLGVSGIAAVGAAEWIIWMMQGMIQGFTQGFGIQMSQDFGARQYQRLRNVIVNSAFLSAASAVIMLLGGQIFAAWMLGMLHTPDTVWADTMLYMRTMFWGIPVVMAYNLFASILRSLGDGKTPLYAMICASFINIGLDLLFVPVLHMGVFGAAAATVLAQLCSSLFCLVKITRIDILKFQREDYALHTDLHLRLMKLGMPMAFQNFVISVGGMIVQSVVNGFGVAFIAGFTATNKLYGMLEVAATSYGFSMTTYTGQNLGAGKTTRIRKGYREALIIAMITSVVIAAVMIFAGKWILLCFINGDEQTTADTLAIAYRYLFIMSICLPVLYYLHVTRSCIQGLGNTVLPMISGCAEFAMRTAAALLLPIALGRDGIFYAEIAAWAGADIVLFFSFFYSMR